MAQWVEQSGFWLDCTGAGELYIAKSANFPRERLLVHGVNKSATDLQAAYAQAGTIVVDNLTELHHLLRLNHHSLKSCRKPSALPNLWLRVRPGIAVETHKYTQTGQEDSKFGMNLAEALHALELARQHDFSVTGIHFHQGSHFHNPEPIGPALNMILDLLVEIRDQSGWLPERLCPGGGWGVPYHEDDLPHPSIGDYVTFVAETLEAGCRERDLALPALHLEPGRSLVAQAGVAIYQVGSVKETQQKRWYLIDGGMADNPRPALYQARYTALPVVEQSNRPVTTEATLGGPFCESGDILIHDLALPDLLPGEWIAVPVSGAYQLAMGSNYNGATRPAVVWLDQGEAYLIQRRETVDDLITRDLPFPSS